MDRQYSIGTRRNFACFKCGNLSVKDVAQGLSLASSRRSLSPAARSEPRLSPASAEASPRGSDEVAELMEQLTRLEETLKARENNPTEETALKERLARLGAEPKA